jgi:hypothetical protein
VSGYLPGQRAVLIHTGDPHTRTLGTVHRHHQQSNTVAVSWDDRSTLTMLLDDSDRIALAGTPPTTEEGAGRHHGDTDQVGQDAPASMQDGRIPTSPSSQPATSTD